MSSDKLVFDLGRRRFIKAAGVGGVFVVGLPLIVAQHSFAQAATDDTDHAQPNVFVGINADGTVEITCHRSDMGQHIRTEVVPGIWTVG
jgi:isoquinoline 1-oxidoreductase subunit beta